MDKTPRYLQLANRLRLAIESGEYNVGDQLPTEHELCCIHNISRHTARAALHRLEEVGLISRRRGAGTRVISTGTPPAFVQPLGGLDELMQYARHARFKISSHLKMMAPDKELSEINIDRGDWITLHGVRLAEDKCVAATSIYVIDSFGDDPEDYINLPHAITEALRRRHGITIGSITQSIHADMLSQTDAKLLDSTPGAACLKTIRRYFDDSGRMIVVSVSRHAADYFSYEMTYRRP